MVCYDEDLSLLILVGVLVELMGLLQKLEVIPGFCGIIEVGNSQRVDKSQHSLLVALTKALTTSVDEAIHPTHIIIGDNT